MRRPARTLAKAADGMRQRFTPRCFQNSASSTATTALRSTGGMSLKPTTTRRSMANSPSRLPSRVVDLRDDVRLEVLERRDLGEVRLVGEQDADHGPEDDGEREEEGEAGPLEPPEDAGRGGGRHGATITRPAPLTSDRAAGVPCAADAWRGCSGAWALRGGGGGCAARRASLRAGAERARRALAPSSRRDALLARRRSAARRRARGAPRVRAQPASAARARRAAARRARAPARCARRRPSRRAPRARPALAARCAARAAPRGTGAASRVVAAARSGVAASSPRRPGACAGRARSPPDAGAPRSGRRSRAAGHVATCAAAGGRALRAAPPASGAAARGSARPARGFAEAVAAVVRCSASRRRRATGNGIVVWLSVRSSGTVSPGVGFVRTLRAAAPVRGQRRLDDAQVPGQARARARRARAPAPAPRDRPARAGGTGPAR